MARRISSVRPQVTLINRSIRQLERAVHTLAAKARQLERAASKDNGPVPVRRKMTITPQRRAQLKLQGQYMGLMRQLKARQKAQVKAAKEKGGYRAGIAMARRMAKGMAV